MAKQGITKDKPPTAEQMQQIVKVSRGFQFALSLPPETDAHYAGADAKLGDATRAVFWYLPEKSKKYRVIYADFSVKELAAAPELKGAVKLSP